MSRQRPGSAVPPKRFPPALVYRAAKLYYLQDATQAEIAELLGTSRPTVSRLLAEARATGIVHVEVREPKEPDIADLAQQLRGKLGLNAVHLATPVRGMSLGPLLEAEVSGALRAAQLEPGDTVLVSSGATLHAVAQQHLPSLPGVLLCPTVGGIDESEAAYQTNEITRTMAQKVGGTPVLLYAPALPSEDLWEALTEDPAVQRVQGMWRTAKVALLGIGAPPSGRDLIPSALEPHRRALVQAAGDICARPYDAEGRPVEFPGADRMMAISRQDLQRVQHSIAIAVGDEKVLSITAAARARLFNTLVTDSHTAQQIVAAFET